jgi:hypothetical protein
LEEVHEEAANVVMHAKVYRLRKQGMHAIFSATLRQGIAVE